ncbi:hypothetical protein GCM10010507_05910 [Streptomyces cinnamoneus]|uniref:Uncharacterized protein n=2 Tax=Streptomyces cinnamoneus TaxID=53446 RepID=A0A918TCB8_STRCJ|nr:hypothetical protein GCM10010507_05910 [Streptomyces cinnamoneus]
MFAVRAQITPRAGRERPHAVARSAPDTDSGREARLWEAAMMYDRKAEADMRLYSEKKAAELAQKRREAEAEAARSRADAEAAEETGAEADPELDDSETESARGRGISSPGT